MGKIGRNLAQQELHGTLGDNNRRLEYFRRLIDGAPWDKGDSQGLRFYKNELYLVDWDRSRIFVFDQGGAFIRSFGKDGSGSGEIKNPFDCHVYEDEVYVADQENHRIDVFSTGGVYKRKWGTEGAGDGQFEYPMGIFVYKGELYVVDKYNYRFQIFDPDGTFKRKFTLTYGSGPGQTRGPNFIAIYNDEIFRSDYNTPIIVTDLYGTYKRQFGTQGTGNGQLAGSGYRNFISIFKDEVFITDGGNNRVQVFDLQGNYKRKWGSVGTGPNHFNYPSGITNGRTGVYISSGENGNYQVFSKSSLQG